MGEPQEQEDAPQQITPFATILQQQRRGAMTNELSQKLHDLVGAVDFLQKAGSITITLTVKPTNGGVLIGDKIVVKEPVSANSESFFYVNDQDGTLSREDPQAEKHGNLRSVGNDTVDPANLKAIGDE